MSGICGSVKAAGALPPPPPRSHLLLPTFFCRTHYMSPWRLGGLPSMSSTSVVATAGPVTSTPLGAAIDISSFSGRLCRTYRKHPRGACHRRLQLRWWPLPDMPLAPPRGPAVTSSTSIVATVGHAANTPTGPASTSSTSVVATAGHTASTPPGGPHRHLQLWWWPLPDIPPGALFPLHALSSTPEHTSPSLLR
jgi:hypothetical protein